MTQPRDPYDDDSWRDNPTGGGLEQLDESLGPHSTEVGQEVRVLRVAGPETRPDIPILPDIHLTTDAMVRCLSKDPLVFQRGGELVHVTRAAARPEGTKSKTDIPPGTPTIRSTPVSWLADRISERARCVVRRKRKEGGEYWLHVPPPKGNVLSSKERGEWDGVRPLVGVNEAPSLRPDGTVWQEPGYDKMTGFVYAPNAKFPEIEDKPSQSAARAALDNLLGVFADFPYANPAHAIIPVAAILTILARPAIDGAIPAFAFDAATRGSGKTLQSDVVSVIATGRTAARATYPEKDEELEKSLFAFASLGVRVALLDNVTRAVGSGALDMVLTCRDEIAFRVLGRTEIQTVPWRALLMFSGNNLVLGEDTTRRSLIARLESPLERPEERTGFRHPDLIPWVMRWRPQLAADALTVLRAFTAAGRPSVGCGVWGSFEEWSALVPPAIVYAGGADPLPLRASRVSGVSDAGRMLRVLVSGLGRLSPDAAISARAIVSALYPDRDPHDGPRAPDGYEELREVIEDLTNTPPGRRPDSKRLGRWLQKKRGQVSDGALIQSVMNPRDNSALWRAVRV